MPNRSPSPRPRPHPRPHPRPSPRPSASPSPNPNQEGEAESREFEKLVSVEEAKAAADSAVAATQQATTECHGSTILPLTLHLNP